MWWGWGDGHHSDHCSYDYAASDHRCNNGATSDYHNVGGDNHVPRNHYDYHNDNYDHATLGVSGRSSLPGRHG